MGNGGGGWRGVVMVGEGEWWWWVKGSGDGGGFRGMVVGGEERRKEGKEESRWKGRTEGGEGGRKEAKVLTLLWGQQSPTLVRVSEVMTSYKVNICHYPSLLAHPTADAVITPTAVLLKMAPSPLLKVVPAEGLPYCFCQPLLLLSSPMYFSFADPRYSRVDCILSLNWEMYSNNKWTMILVLRFPPRFYVFFYVFPILFPFYDAFLRSPVFF